MLYFTLCARPYGNLAPILQHLDSNAGAIWKKYSSASLRMNDFVWWSLDFELGHDLDIIPIALAVSFVCHPYWDFNVSDNRHRGLLDVHCVSTKYIHLSLFQISCERHNHCDLRFDTQSLWLAEERGGGCSSSSWRLGVPCKNSWSSFQRVLALVHPSQQAEVATENEWNHDWK